MAEAQALAERLLAEPLPRRWRHVQAVGRRAEQVSALLDVDGQALVAAAWLHDIGYAPEAVDSGFHPLDGARLLRGMAVDERVVCLVAHHSCAVVEADERGLSTELAEFPREESPTADALWYCDMTTGPDGERLAVAGRLDEIRKRYGPGHIVTRFVDRAESQIMAAVRRTEDRLRLAGAAR